MKTAILVVAANKDLNTFVGLKKDRALPAQIPSHRYFLEKTVSFEVKAFLFSGTKDESAFLTEVTKIYDVVDAIIVLLDKDVLYLDSMLGSSAFIRKFDSCSGNIQNAFRRAVANAMKEFAIVSRLFDDIKFQKILLLPLRNFLADELVSLKYLVENGGEDFSKRVDALIARLRKRQTPKKISRSCTIYYKDDRNFYFEYGHEKHARPDSKMPPHLINCMLTAKFRFGRRYDSHRHFNVSCERKEEVVRASFHDCHGQSCEVGGRSHVNLFPNDFLG